MGCDGGTIPKRAELVQTAKRPEQKDKDMERKAKWSSCCITQQPLTQPVMVCELGRLYSKESILEFLLDRSINENSSHITTLKNVKELKLTDNPGFDKNPSGCHDQYYDTQVAKYVCPVVGLEMNGKYKFCVLWSCGCVLSDRALKEVESDNCHSCGTKFEKDDIMVIYPEADDLALMKVNTKLRKERLKALRKESKSKKSSKRKLENSDSKKKLVNGESESKKLNGNHKFDVPKKLNGNHKFDVPKKLNGNDKFDVPKKLVKKAACDVSSSGSGSSSNGIDPKQSEVYKRLFTSGAEKQSKDCTPHWVTYNPYHL